MNNLINLEEKYLNNLVYLGHNVKRLSTNMFPYILNIKNNHHVLNLERTSKLLKLSKNILNKTLHNNKKILFIGTDSISSSLITYYAIKTNNYYINSHWIGGLLTNWNTNKNQILNLNNLENTINTNSFLNLNLKEINSYKKKYEKLKFLYNGIKKMSNLPDLVFFTNPKKDNIALNECFKLGIPTIALVDTNINININTICYPIPINTNSSFAINYIFNYLFN